MHIHDTDSAIKEQFSVRTLNRIRAWEWGADCAKSDASVWQLEWVKVAIERAEEKQFLLPSPKESPRKPQKKWRLVLAIMGGFLISICHMLRYCCGVGQQKLSGDTLRFAAVHAEWSTRTRHLIKAIDHADPPICALILLGRVNCKPKKIAALWRVSNPRGVAASLPLVHPISPKACLLALKSLPELFRNGVRSLSFMPIKLSIRDLVAISFRVFSGMVAHEWWRESGYTGEVIFGITGTADTTLLERAIQMSGGRTVHLVHGQATGPNFIGFSDLALFRSQHDAVVYDKLSCYRRCSIQTVSKPELKRGTSGLLLLTNLAHPMNVDFRSNPLKDEILLLRCLGAAARKLGVQAFPLIWKPHPVIAELPENYQSELRSVAFKEGFNELPADADVFDVASISRWVVSSPSTVALDLLQEGILSLILDPQNTVLDTALSNLPEAPIEPACLSGFLRKMDEEGVYRKNFDKSFAMIGPAGPISLDW